jgi:hypothetical protein
MAKKNTGKGFCPFCGMRFAGDHDSCPFCGQDLRMYKDDLGPILDKVQTATNIDMKSPKVRVAMSIVVFMLVFAGALVVFHYWDDATHASEQIPPDGPNAQGVIVEIRNNGYMDLTGDFSTRDLTVMPQYDPDLKLIIKLDDKYQGKYDKVLWIVQTDSYSPTNSKNPFYQYVMKESSSALNIYSVTWDNVTMGNFSITANCYGDRGLEDVFLGKGVYYGKMDTTYTWNYNGTEMSFDFTMSSDDVKRCLNVDLESRMDLQYSSSMGSFVTDNDCIKQMNEKLLSLFNRNYSYSDARFADFVLCFVQSCFPDVNDSFNYHVTDYWAYPMETILRGCGDDEDRAILFCALLNTLNSDDVEVALIHLPDATMAAVHMDISSSYIDTYAKNVRGHLKWYTVADPTPGLSLGEMREGYDVSYDGRGFFYNGQPTPGLDRLEPI